ncbi:MAG: hotdog fold thioesterase [Pseudomonadota bacterium]
MTPIWHIEPSLEWFTKSHEKTAVSHLGIEFLDAGPDWMTARMPVDARTVQPMGLLHGGASVLLAETLGSVASVAVVDFDKQVIVGQEINANHLRPVSSGWVTGEVRPIHLGRRSHVWAIEIRDEAGKLTCISRLTVAVMAREG